MDQTQGIRPAGKMIRISKPEANHPSPATLKYMRSQGGRWACYQNMDKAHLEFGRLTFLSYGGPKSTFVLPPPRHPDTPNVGTSGWRYVFVGFVDLKTGEVVDEEP